MLRVNHPDHKQMFLRRFCYSKERVVTDRFGSYTIKYQLLGGLVKFKTYSWGGWRLSILGISVLSKKTGTFKFFGVSIYKNYNNGWLDRIQIRIGMEYDDVYIIRHSLGESYVQLMHLGEAIKVNKSKKPVLILWSEKHAEFYQMFLPAGMDMISIDLRQRDINTVFDKKTPVIWHNGQRFICRIPWIVPKMKELLATGTQVNFYDYINECAGVVKGKTPVLPKPSTEASRRVTTKISRIKLSDKFIILCPETHSLMPLEEIFWENLEEGLRQKGYDIFVNVHENEPFLKNAKSTKMTIEEMFILAQQSSGIISLGSGLAVFLTAAGVKMDLLYTNTAGNLETSEFILQLYSVHHIPGVSRALVKEYDTSKLNGQNLVEIILERY